MLRILIYGWIFVIAHVVLTWFLAIRRGRQARLKKTRQQIPPMEDLLPVSIIVPAWNEKGTIETCIEALKNIDYPTWEAIIMAGGEDRTYEITNQCIDGDDRFRVLKRGPEPKNAAISRGINLAQNRILVLLDADSVVDTGWLTALINPLILGATASFGMHYPANETWISIEEHMEVFHAYHIMHTKLAQGCSSLAIWRKSMEEIEPLPSNAFSWEDWDIVVRLIDANESIVFAPEAMLRTPRPSTIKEYWDAIFRSYTSHIAGIWYHRAKFLRQPIWAISETFFIGFSTILVLGTIAGIFTILVEPSSAPVVINIAIMTVIWIAGRRAVLGPEIGIYTLESRWVKRAWLPVAILPIQFLAAFIALLRVRKQPSFDYKGPRNQNL